MWKIVTGVAVVALAIFFVLRHDSGKAGEQPGMSTDAQSSSAAPSQNAAADNAVQPRFTNYENEANRPRRITKSTTGTIVVFPDGRRSPPR